MHIMHSPQNNQPSIHKYLEIDYCKCNLFFDKKMSIAFKIAYKREKKPVYKNSFMGYCGKISANWNIDQIASFLMFDILDIYIYV